MFSSLCFGFFDPIRLRQHESIVRHPLDPQVIESVFRQWGGILSDGIGLVDGHRFILHPEGFLESTTVLTTHRVMDFIEQLVQETSCEIASPTYGGILTLQSLVTNFDHLSRIFATAPANESRAIDPTCVPVSLEQPVTR